mgnify:FL=1
MVLIRWDVFFLLWAGMMVFHLVTYFGSQYLEGEPHTVGGALDERIPFHPGWIYIYSSWFVLLLGVVQFGLSYVFLSRGLDAVSPVTASLTSTIEPILNPILVAVFYGETIGATAVIGALLVVGSATVYNVRQAKNAA